MPLAGLIANPRNPLFVTHSVADILRAHVGHRVWLRGHRRSRPTAHDFGFKLACGRLPDSGRDLCSQPTVLRWGVCCMDRAKRFQIFEPGQNGFDV